MVTTEKFAKAMILLDRITSRVEIVPGDPTFWRDYYSFTGRHMIMTDEGWEPGECKTELLEEYRADGESEDTIILDEVNAPHR